MTLAVAHRTPTDRMTQAHVTETLLLERVRELIRFRAWYRRQPRFDVWSGLALRNDIELHALLTIARRARRLTRAELVLDTRGWAPGELTEAFGS